MRYEVGDSRNKRRRLRDGGETKCAGCKRLFDSDGDHLCARCRRKVERASRARAKRAAWYDD